MFGKLEIIDLIYEWAKENFENVTFSFERGPHVKIKWITRNKAFYNGRPIVQYIYTIRHMGESHLMLVKESFPNHRVKKYNVSDPECFSKMLDTLKLWGVNLKCN